MKLLEAINVGNNTLKNSMVMTPMTRGRANYDGIVGKSTKLYYTMSKCWFNHKRSNKYV